jgi:Zn-dependent protease/predicted transcriptional regulator
MCGGIFNREWTSAVKRLNHRVLKTEQPMKWSLKLGTIAGIGIFMHWSFLLLIAWIFFVFLHQGQGVVAALRGAGFVFAVFGCVVLHELGHALMARRFHIRTRDITLLPIGGLARLERMPEDPRHEFWVAVAGPAVNVAIAAILAGIIAVLGGSYFELDLVGGGFLLNLLLVNLLLVGFNMLPAFPMDGGRVLRALLSMRIDRLRATRVASAIGQAMAVVFAVAGLLMTPINPFLILIAVFVFFGARAEARQAEVNQVIHDLKVSDAMITRFQSLSADDPLFRASEELIAGSQQDFPVLEGGRVAGMLRRDDLLKALSERNGDSPVREAMTYDCKVVRETDSLRRTLEAMREGGCFTVPVVREDRLVGILTLENIGELLMLDSALHQGGQVQPHR